MEPGFLDRSSNATTLEPKLKSKQYHVPIARTDLVICSRFKSYYQSVGSSCTIKLDKKRMNTRAHGMQ
jgi:hypothetical protein